MIQKKRSNLLGAVQGLLHRVLVLLGGSFLALVVFLLLPLIQAVTKQENTTLALQSLDTVVLPPPPATEPEPPPEQEEEEPTPELAEDTTPLDIANLDLALNASFGDGGGADYVAALNTLPTAGAEAEALLAFADISQEPRLIYEVNPVITAKLRRQMPATVNVILIVDERGRVADARIHQSSNAQFDRPALAAVRQWRFEPAKRDGEPVKRSMRVPISFKE